MSINSHSVTVLFQRKVTTNKAMTGANQGHVSAIDRWSQNKAMIMMCHI